jgi:hypothetical protein
MVTIATLNEPAKAKEIKSRFQQAGLRADVHNEAHLQAVGFVSKPQANAKVLVDDKDFERAQSLMIEWEATDPVTLQLWFVVPNAVCPELHLQMTRKFTPALVILSSAQDVPKEFYCQDCHFT